MILRACYVVCLPDGTPIGNMATHTYSTRRNAKSHRAILKLNPDYKNVNLIIRKFHLTLVLVPEIEDIQT